MIDNTKPDNIFISVPFKKVDKENRLVSGFATLDNVDKQGDMVTAECAKKAFEGFRGNLRQMHTPDAVGKVISFRDESYFDPGTQETYNGVYVTAYISKGAPEAWLKVLDETYTGFSIGGRMKSKETIIKSGNPVRVINDMELYELSLVDSPANDLANILCIQKIDGEPNAITGISADIKIDDIFYCKSCEILAPGQADKDCLMCQSSMENIGWMENVNAQENVEKMTKMLDAYLEKADKSPYGDVAYADPGYQEDKKKRYPIDTEEHVRAALAYINQADNAEKYNAKQLAEIKSKISAAAKKFGINVSVHKLSDAKSEKADGSLHKNKGGDLMETQDEVVKSDDASEVTEDVIEKSASESETAEDVVEKSDVEAEVEAVEKSDSEVVAEEVAEDEVVKVNDFKEIITEVLSQFAASQMEAVTKALAEVTETTESKLDSLKKEFADSLENVTKAFDERVSGVESSTAIKKSGDLGGESEYVEKNVWNGAFAPTRFFDSNSIVK